MHDLLVQRTLVFTVVIKTSFFYNCFDFFDLQKLSNFWIILCQLKLDICLNLFMVFFIKNLDDLT